MDYNKKLMKSIEKKAIRLHGEVNMFVPSANSMTPLRD
jgi:hypothetical protein